MRNRRKQWMVISVFTLILAFAVVSLSQAAGPDPKKTSAVLKAGGGAVGGRHVLPVRAHDDLRPDHRGELAGLGVGRQCVSAAQRIIGQLAARGAGHRPTGLA